MSQPHASNHSSLYRWVAWLLIIASTGIMVGRILAVRASTGETPMLSANDRSRWCTIRALVDDGTYAIDSIIREKHPDTGRRYWSTIDRVRHRGRDGKEHDFSSKPPLYPTLLAGEYWLVKQVTGASIGQRPFLVMRVMLIITNVSTMLLFFWILWLLLDKLAVSESARLYVLAVAAFGTLLTAFAVTLNNHLPAAAAALVAIYLVWPARSEQVVAPWRFAVAGLSAAFAVANELPALSFLAALGLLLVWRFPRPTLTWFAPAALVVAAAFFLTNYLAHGTWSPPYAHRKDGPVVTTIDRGLSQELDALRLPDPVRQAMNEAGVNLSDQAVVVEDMAGQRWGICDRVGHKRFAVVDVGSEMQVRQWDNWYAYPGSYWRTGKQGVDKGEASRLAYAVHVLVGHHGILSLTPVWLLSLVGVFQFIAGRYSLPKWFGWLVIGLTVVCLAFYLSRPEADRNYGGVSCGFRWMIWFTPLWLIAMVPAVESLLTRKYGRALALVLLLISCLSVAYSCANPWSHPWLFQLGTYAGWWSY
jgi:hypothetical protein